MQTGKDGVRQLTLLDFTDGSAIGRSNDKDAVLEASCLLGVLAAGFIRLTIRPNGYMERGWQWQLIARSTKWRRRPAAAAAAAAPVWPATAIATKQLDIVDVLTEMRIAPQR